MLTNCLSTNKEAYENRNLPLYQEKEDLLGKDSLNFGLGENKHEALIVVVSSKTL
jgi:hypothetical protein